MTFFLFISKIIEKDFASNVICNDCWWKTKNFHKFYNEVKKVHNNYLNISKSMNKDNNDNNPNIDIKFVKVENIDEDSNGIDSNEIPYNTIINENHCDGISTIIKDEKEIPKSIVENDSSGNIIFDYFALYLII